MLRERHDAVASEWLGDRRRLRPHGIRLYSSIRFQRSPLYMGQLYSPGLPQVQDGRLTCDVLCRGELDERFQPQDTDKGDAVSVSK